MYLAQNLFKIFVNDLPDYLTDSPDSVYINDLPLNCLMYADDIVLLSTSTTGLQDKLDKLSKFCQDWCLEVNASKTKVLVFNKSGEQMQNDFFFGDICLENVKHCCYLGVYFLQVECSVMHRLIFLRNQLKPPLNLLSQ